MPATEWVTQWRGDGIEFLADAGGVPWNEAPLPRRLHRCRPQTRGYIHGSAKRCPCGAIRRSMFGPWLDRNSRRRHA